MVFVALVLGADSLRAGSADRGGQRLRQPRLPGDVGPQTGAALARAARVACPIARRRAAGAAGTFLPARGRCSSARPGRTRGERVVGVVGAWALRTVYWHAAGRRPAARVLERQHGGRVADAAARSARCRCAVLAVGVAAGRGGLWDRTCPSATRRAHRRGAGSCARRAGFGRALPPLSERARARRLRLAGDASRAVGPALRGGGDGLRAARAQMASSRRSLTPMRD